MNNKYISLLILIPLFSLNSCNKLIVGSDPLADVKPGEVPDGGEVLSIEQVNDLFDKSFLDIKLKDGLKLDIANSNIKYEQVYNDFSTIYELSNLNANLTIDGLKTANSFNELDASITASADFYAFNEQMNMEFTKANYNANVYLNDGNAYFNFSQSIIDMFNLDYPTSFYLTIPEGFDSNLTEEFGLTYPLMSENNLSILNEIFKTPEGAFTIDLNEILYDNVVKVYKYDNDYLLSVNITKDNINQCFSEVLTSLYEQDLFDLILNHEVLPAEFNELKEEYLKTFKEYTKDFNHFKASVTFDEEFFKSVSLDFDVSINIDEFQHKVKGNIDLSIDYSDDVAVQFPTLENYEEYVKEVTDLLKISEEVNSILASEGTYSYNDLYEQIGDPTNNSVMFGLNTSVWVLDENGKIYENFDDLYEDILKEGTSYYEVLIAISANNQIQTIQYGKLSEDDLKSIMGGQYE